MGRGPARGELGGLGSLMLGGSPGKKKTAKAGLLEDLLQGLRFQGVRGFRNLELRGSRSRIM